MGGVRLSTIIFTIINYALLVAIIIGIYKAMKKFKNYFNKNKKIEEKLDIILEKLERKEDN